MFEGGSGEIQRIFESAGLTGVLPIAFPGAAHPSTAPGGGPDHDWTAEPDAPAPRRCRTSAFPGRECHRAIAA